MTKLAFHPLDPRSARARLVLAACLGIVAWFVEPARFATSTRAVMAWDASGLTLLVLGVMISRTTPEGTRRRAAARDPGRTLVWLVVLAASAVSLFAATVVVSGSNELPAAESGLVLVLSIATVLISWLLTHTAFTLRYAHLFYRGGPDGEGGLEFPGGTKPDDYDFAYFAFTIGMCFQTSDVTISDRVVRRTALAHAFLSFLYNTVVLALVVNLIVGHAS